jgi:transcriptional regulator with XRE-family HTH domain
MTARERALHKARRKSVQQLATLASELRDARITAGRTQADVARAAAISTSELSRIELGRTAALQFETVAAVGAVLGLDVVLRAYPGDHVLADEPQVRLLRAFRERLGPDWTWRFETKVAPGDQRTWDASGSHRRGGVAIVVDAETRVRDFQAVMRRVGAKREAPGSSRTILLIADTRTNRAAIAAARDELAAEFPMNMRATLRALRAGREPGADGLIVLPPWRPRPEPDDPTGTSAAGVPVGGTLDSGLRTSPADAPSPTIKPATAQPGAARHAAAPRAAALPAAIPSRGPLPDSGPNDG